MFCLASKPFSALNESISVSNAESQLALPLATMTFLPSSVIGSPKGSAVCTVADGAGFCAADGEGDAVGLAAGSGEALAAGEGLAEALGAGEGLAEALGAGDGDCASDAPAPSQIAAAGTSAANARREGRNFIR